MKRCTGTPAELCALPYIEGTLPEHQLELFEAHFFECSVCLAYLQDLQAMQAALSRLTATKIERPTQRGLPILPTRTWALGAAAAIVLAAIFSFRALNHGPKPTPVAQSIPPAAVPAKPQEQAHAASPISVRPSQLADLALPPFVAPNLRGAQEDVEFESGMKDYAKGDCPEAVAELARVPAQSEDLRAARFYCAACEMQMGNLTEAESQMHTVATAGDSPQQESALYYEAQIALANDDPAAAHRYLVQTIALQGDLEQKARDEDRKIHEFLGEQPLDNLDKPETVAR